MTTTLQIGKPNYNRTSEKLVYYRLGMNQNQRELILRLAPPIKSLAESGNYAVYHKQHFGYQLTGKGDKPFPAVFNCIERRDRNKNVTQECPECTEIAMRKAALEAKEAAMKARGDSSDVIEAALRPQREWLKSHNLDRKWIMLAKDQKGVWGFLSLNHTAFGDLQREIKDIIASGKAEDPLGVKGVWFRFTRTGEKFNDINDTAKVVEQAVNVEVSGKSIKTFVVKEDVLTDADFSALEALPELTNLGRKISFEQIRMLVESGGDEQVVKSVFDSGSKSESTPVRVGSTPTAVSVATQPTGPSAGVEMPAAADKAAPAVSAGVADAAALQAQLEALKAALAAAAANPETRQLAAAAAKPETRQPTPTMVKQLDMDPDEFLAQYGQK